MAKMVKVNESQKNNNVNQNNQTTFEKSKTTKYVVSMLNSKIESQVIRFNHPNQRESDQWSNKMKGNLISDIIQHNPIPAIVLAEQNINGQQIIWDIDGKQRCMNIYNYVKNNYKIPKGIRRNIISYQRQLRDCDGNFILDDDGYPVVEWCEFNITNKYFKDLPKELQDLILTYEVDATMYLNCSSEDIVYHIARYNDGKPMNKSQKGTVNLGEEYAKEVKKIAKHNFFVDFGDYGKGDTAKKSGVIDRIICETVMASNYINNWKSNHEDTCNYIRNNASMDNFNDVSDTLDRLEEIMNGEVESLFTIKDSAIWFTVFNRFKSTGYNDNAFYDFMEWFLENNICEREFNGVRYSDLEGGNDETGRKSTKDKSCVMNKIDHLCMIMNIYFSETMEKKAV